MSSSRPSNRYPQIVVEDEDEDGLQAEENLPAEDEYQEAPWSPTYWLFSVVVMYMHCSFIHLACILLSLTQPEDNRKCLML